MNILVYDNSGHPFQVHLSRALAKRGYNTLHIFSASFQTPKGNLKNNADDPPTFAIKGITIPGGFNKYSYLKRWKQENQFGKLVIKEINKFKPDALIASNVPLETLKHVARFCDRKDITFIFWVQDFYGMAIHKILKNKIPVVGHLFGLYYKYLEKKILESCDHIILIADDFQEVLNQMKVVNSSITVIPNWSPIEEITVESKYNDWSKAQKLEDKFCFFYTGTLGLKHNPGLLLELAVYFKNNNEVRIVVISEGVGAEWLKTKKKELLIENLIILNFQPFGLLPKVMATADVLVAILDDDAGIYSVPSKILSYLCAQRPLLLGIPNENLSARIVNDNYCGLVVSPSDKREFSIAADKLYKNEFMRSETALNARKYAENNFDINSITERFAHIINNSMKLPHSVGRQLRPADNWRLESQSVGCAPIVETKS